MILLALAFGALGATAHCLYVFLGAIAGRNPGFNAYRIGWFFPQPPLGAILGALLYVAVRGGLLSASSGASMINMFGVAAIAAIGGLSVPRAYQRLTGSPPSGAATATSTQKVAISQVSPATIKATDLPQQVTITGTDLTGANFLLNGRPVLPDSVTATTAVLTVTPADAPAGRAVVVSVAPNVGSSASLKVS